MKSTLSFGVGRRQNKCGLAHPTQQILLDWSSGLGGNSSFVAKVPFYRVSNIQMVNNKSNKSNLKDDGCRFVIE